MSNNTEKIPGCNKTSTLALMQKGNVTFNVTSLLPFSNFTCSLYEHDKLKDSMVNPYQLAITHLHIFVLNIAVDTHNNNAENPCPSPLESPCTC